MKKLTTALVLTLLAASANAWEFSFSPLGWDVDLDLYGMPAKNTGLRLGRNLIVSPYMEVMWGYDSNTSLAKDNKKGSSALTATWGATMSYASPSLHSSISGNLYYSMDRYQRRARDNRDTYGEHFTLRHGTPSGWYATLSEGYVRGMQSSYVTGFSATRDTLNLGATVGRASPATLWNYNGSVSYERTSYASAVYNGNDALSAGLQLSRAISPKTQVNLSGNYSHRSSKNTDPLNNYSLMLGMGSRLLPKLTYTASLGLAYARSNNGWDNWGASYNLGMGWKISNKWSASLHGSSWVQPSEIATRYNGTQNYASLYNTVGAGVTFLPVRKLSATAQVLYRRGQYKYMGDYATSTLNNCVDDLYMARLAASFALSRYLSIVASTQVQTNVSDLRQKEYNEYSASLGLRVKY